MIYVALLRGINVGGNNKVDMGQLRTIFEKVGCTSVTTYINSGNVIFQETTHDPVTFAEVLEQAIEKEFGFNVKVLIRDLSSVEAVVKALPDAWVNDDTMKCDVMFLWENCDKAETLHQLPVRDGLDNARYTPGAILWAVERKNATRSGLSRLASMPIYKQMTIRNCNTTRKLLELMRAKNIGQ